jgi:hypothetical protein
VSGIDAALKPAGTVAGVVTDAVSHKPVVGVPVVVYDSAGRQVTGGCTCPAGATQLMVWPPARTPCRLRAN